MDREPVVNKAKIAVHLLSTLRWPRQGRWLAAQRVQKHSVSFADHPESTDLLSLAHGACAAGGCTPPINPACTTKQDLGATLNLNNGGWPMSG